MAELSDHGYSDMSGVDPSAALIARGRTLRPGLRLSVLESPPHLACAPTTKPSKHSSPNWTASWPPADSCTSAISSCSTTSETATAMPPTTPCNPPPRTGSSPRRTARFAGTTTSHTCTRCCQASTW
ncbi:hypothetical protein AB0N99_07655 [Streptomyces sp. NPDC093272]|uniref:hypothetical protein n=1 Tax=Streptomyces sp. NPDC093272 TaxID=3154981 RepID=UPI003423D27A